MSNEPINAVGSEDLRSLIDACVAKKNGNKEFALFYLQSHPSDWAAEIGNPSGHVGLGEVPGEFGGEGATPEEAVRNLLVNISD